MRNFRTLDEIIEEDLRTHPDEIEDFISILFEEYAESGDTAALLDGLRIVSHIKGVSFVAKNPAQNHLRGHETLSDEPHPKFESVNAIMHALGYRLAPQRLQAC